MVSYISAVGLIALVGGLLGYYTLPTGINMGVKSFVNLAENGMLYSLYMNPPFPARSEFHLFAITNPRQVLRGQKMEFQLKGPFVYETYVERESIVFSKQKDKVSFGSRRRLHLDESQSADLDERIWMLNPIIPGMLKAIRGLVLERIPFRRLSEPIVFNAVNSLLENYKERLIKSTTARDFLQGKTVDLLEAVVNLAARFGLSSLIPPGPPLNKFGLAFAQNETVDHIEIFTGIGDKTAPDRFAEVTRWKDQTEVGAWKGKCRIINGTNGELYKPLVEEGKPLKVFLGPLCRSFLLEPVIPITTDSTSSDQDRAAANGSIEPIEDEQQLVIGEHREQTLANGLKALEYEFDSNLYMGMRSNPQNRCFCENTKTFDCQFDGLISMGPCFFDSPLYFARGNLKGVDRRISGTTKYLSTVGPDKLPDKQSFYLDKLTGSILSVNLTITGIFKVVRQPYMRDLARVQNLTYVPTFLTTETMMLPDEIASQFYSLQMFIDHYEPALLGTSMSGLAILLLKWLFGLGAGATAAKAAVGPSSVP